ncbi:MAG: PQQ-binding-like beta-propeller repeat protein [Kofleriaceae bacterium]
MSARLALVLVAVLAACGPKAVFRLSSDENNPYALNEALGKRRLPAQPTPVSSAGPRAYVLAAGSISSPAKTIVAFDLASQQVAWKTDADVQSRIAVGGDFIVAIEGGQLVARDQSRGAPRWKVDLDGAFVGLAADQQRAYLVTKDGSDYKLTGYAGSDGKELWQSAAAGQLGAPGAHGGVVYVPFLSQWLSIVDGANGEQLTRVRGIDEQISTLRVTSNVAYYGSTKGMFRLDERSASGKRSDATYGKVEIPPQLERTTYSRDAYDIVQQAYTAADRARVLWSSEPSTSGPMKLTGDGYAIHYFRYVLGFDLEGELRWAYSHPRVELVASDHTGSVIVGIAANGDIVALDPQTGGVRARGSLGIGGQVLGATFDADGWAPSTPAEKIETAEALVSIARDRDSRFERVKELAVGALAKLPGAEVTAEMLKILEDDRAKVQLKDTVADLLVKRRDPAGLPVLVEQLAVHDNVIAKTQTQALGPIAKALGGLAGTGVAKDGIETALEALHSHLEAPSTGTADLIHVIAAMAALGGDADGADKPALISHLLLYHADDDRGSDAAWQKAIISGLLVKATSASREALRYVAQDPRTIGSLATAINETIGAD